VRTVLQETCCPKNTDPVSLAFATTGRSRPDVQAAFPAAGPNAGYAIDIPGGHKYRAVRFACAYVLQEGPGIPERFIGCSDESNAEGRA
jgi:hypothetical protein